jgi:methyl-accepting chemotaxis protein
VSSLIARLPKGARLTDESWAARHRVILTLLWLHVPALAVLGLIGPMPWWESVVIPLAIAAFAAGGALAGSRRARAELTSLGLIGSTFAAIELSGGRIDSHLHLYAILIFVALYQQWTPLVWAVGVVVVHHGVLGLLDPERVFGMPMSGGEALLMVSIHAGAALLEVAGILFFWHFAEQVETEAEAQAQAADTANREREAADVAAKEREAEGERLRAAQATAQAQQLAQHAAEVAAGARQAIEAVSAVDTELVNLATAVQDIAQRSSHAAGIASSGQEVAGDATKRMHDLQQSVTEISEVNALIAQLAGQTNLLSLNATIEAARAGEMGKGFAVVASEVKQLANETTSSSSKVNNVIAAVTGQTEAAAHGFASTVSAVAEINEVQIAIAASVEEQAAVLHEITRQLSTASNAAREVLAGLDRLTSDAGVA